MARSRFCGGPPVLSSATVEGRPRRVWGDAWTCCRGPTLAAYDAGVLRSARRPVGQEPSTTNASSMSRPCSAGTRCLTAWAAAYVRVSMPWTAARRRAGAELPVDESCVRMAGDGARRRATTTATITTLRSRRFTESRSAEGTAPRSTAPAGPPTWKAAVAFVDACLRSWRSSPRPSCRPTYAAAHRGWRGVGQQPRAALAQTWPRRGTSGSRGCALRGEGVGLPAPEVNLPVFDQSGGLLGIPDLLWPEAALVLEYDGSGHRDRRQHRDDNVREELLEGSGLTVVRADSLDLSGHRVRLRERIQSGYRRGMARDRGRDTWTVTAPTWWSEQETSGLLSDEEKAADLRRLTTSANGGARRAGGAGQLGHHWVRAMAVAGRDGRAFMAWSSPRISEVPSRSRLVTSGSLEHGLTLGEVEHERGREGVARSTGWSGLALEDVVAAQLGDRVAIDLEQLAGTLGRLVGVVRACRRRARR